MTDPNDLPYDDLIAKGNEALRMGWTVYFKFTCQYCGERVVFDQPNTIYRRGECCKCGKVTNIVAGGMLVVYTKEPKDQANENN